MKVGFRLGFALVFLFSLVPVASFAQKSTSEVLALEETIMPMSIPSDNKLPWGFVEGKVTSPAQGHPVIIQIYKDDKPVHFAQVPVNDDGTYQYRFRALDISEGKTTRIFDGDYTVKIFKTINFDSDYINSLVEQKKAGISNFLIDTKLNL